MSVDRDALAWADAVGDAAIAVWDGKFHYGWWRPITAIREADTDGNPNTTGVPGWTPLIVTRPYPDWPSDLCAVIGAASTVLSQLNPDGRVDVSLASVAAGVTRHYDFAADIQHDAVDARVFSGITSAPPTRSPSRSVQGWRTGPSTTTSRRRSEFRLQGRQDAAPALRRQMSSPASRSLFGT